jgi:ABC-type transporter Mla MlaB component
MSERRRTVTMTVPSPLGRAELPALFARTCELLALDRGCELLLCEVGDIAADAVAVDALARLALAARRSGCEVRLRGASPELLGLVELIGLGEVLRSEEVLIGQLRLGDGDAVAIAGRATARRGWPAPGRGGPGGC